MTVRTYAKKGKRELQEKEKETRLNRIEKDITQKVEYHLMIQIQIHRG
jgi:hypothetical protein